MKNMKYPKRHLAIILTFIISLSMIASNILMVQADVGGTGKFLTIEFGDADQSNCYINATKISSNQVFTFLANETSSLSQKVGAGTVILEAYPDTDNGWIFQHFLIGTEERENGTEYKPEKLDVVLAVFETITFDIEISIDGGFGAIWFVEENRRVAYSYPEEENNPVTVSVNYGSTPTFVFIPMTAPEVYHVSAVLVDATSYVDLVLTEFTQSYQFPNITDDGHSLAVTFSLDGHAYIPAGSDITVFLSSSASLKFLTTVNEGFADGNTITPVIEGDIIVWNITVNTNYGDVVIALIYPEDLPPTTILTCKDPDFELFLKSDLNNDGVINGQDVKIIANVVKHDKFIPDEEDPLFAILDVNDDTYINEEDVHAVNLLNGVEISDYLWEPLDNIFIDSVNHIIYGTTDHFSIFRCR